MEKIDTDGQDDFLSLYRRAFREFGGRALWNVREIENPLPGDMLAITPILRLEGNLFETSAA